jgi:hypothetical protein
MKKLLNLFVVAALVLAPVLAVTPAVAADDDYDWNSFWDEVEEESDKDNKDDGGILAGFGILTCCLMIIPLLIWLAISYFVVYKDAVKNNVSSPILWLLVTFFFGLLGLLIYFLVGKKNAKPVAAKAE